MLDYDGTIFDIFKKFNFGTFLATQFALLVGVCLVAFCVGKKIPSDWMYFIAFSWLIANIFRNAMSWGIRIHNRIKGGIKNG